MRNDNNVSRLGLAVAASGNSDSSVGGSDSVDAPEMLLLKQKKKGQCIPCVLKKRCW
jgi:hypothetical protein